MKYYLRYRIQALRLPSKKYILYIILLVALFSLVYSCKTCKCPAYSKTQFKVSGDRFKAAGIKPQNSGFSLNTRLSAHS